MREGFPPFELDDATKAEVVREVTDAPGHDADFWVGQASKAWLVEMIEVGVGQENQVDGRQMFNPQAGTFDAFEQEKPICEIGIDQDIQVVELDKKGGVANPSDRYLAFGELGKGRFAMLPGAPGKQGFPNHFAEKGAWIEMFGWG